MRSNGKTKVLKKTNTQVAVSSTIAAAAGIVSADTYSAPENTLSKKIIIDATSTTEIQNDEEVIEPTEYDVMIEHIQKTETHDNATENETSYEETVTIIEHENEYSNETTATIQLVSELISTSTDGDTIIYGTGTSNEVAATIELITKLVAISTDKNDVTTIEEHNEIVTENETSIDIQLQTETADTNDATDTLLSNQEIDHSDIDAEDMMHLM